MSYVSWGLGLDAPTGGGSPGLANTRILVKAVKTPDGLTLNPKVNDITLVSANSGVAARPSTNKVTVSSGNSGVRGDPRKHTIVTTSKKNTVTI
jgi:hypothetical protein